MSASSERIFENSNEDKCLNFSGKGDQANIVAFGHGISQPDLEKDSTRTSRLSL